MGTRLQVSSAHTTNPTTQVKMKVVVLLLCVLGMLVLTNAEPAPQRPLTRTARGFDSFELFDDSGESFYMRALMNNRGFNRGFQGRTRPFGGSFGTGGFGSGGFGSGGFGGGFSG